MPRAAIGVRHLNDGTIVVDFEDLPFALFSVWQRQHADLGEHWFLPGVGD